MTDIFLKTCMNALLIMAILFLEILSYKQDKPAQVELRKKKKKKNLLEDTRYLSRSLGG